jgi:hypothetical protein
MIWFIVNMMVVMGCTCMLGFSMFCFSFCIDAYFFSEVFMTILTDNSEFLLLNVDIGNNLWLLRA